MSISIEMLLSSGCVLTKQAQLVSKGGERLTILTSRAGTCKQEKLLKTQSDYRATHAPVALVRRRRAYVGCPTRHSVGGRASLGSHFHLPRRSSQPVPEKEKGGGDWVNYQVSRSACSSL